MNNKINKQRRTLLKYAGITAAAASIHPDLLFAMNSSKGNRASANFHPDVENELKQQTAQVSITVNGRRLATVFS